MKKARGAFTLVELSITVLIISLISVVLVMVLRSNINTMSLGQKHMNFNQRLLLAVRRIFYDIKNINPPVMWSSSVGYEFRGSAGQPRPKMVDIKKFNKPGANDVLEFVLDSDEDVDLLFSYKYYVKDGNLKRYKRDMQGKETVEVILENVSDFQLENDDNDIKQIYVSFTARDPENTLRPEKIEFAVRLESDFVCVRKEENSVEENLP